MKIENRNCIEESEKGLSLKNTNKKYKAIN